MSITFRGMKITGIALLWPFAAFAVDDKKPELSITSFSGLWGENNNCDMDDGLMRIDTAYKDNFTNRKPFLALVIYEEVCEIKSVQVASVALTLKTSCRDPTEVPQKRIFKIIYLDRDHIKFNGKSYKRC